MTGSTLHPGSQPGAQPGNTNALKHGFYSRRFSNSECLDLAVLIYRSRLHAFCE